MAYDAQAFRWTPELHDRLVQLHREGWSFGLIGRELGCSRNAAIGKFHRLAIKAGIRLERKKAPSTPKRVYRKPSKPGLTGVFTLRAIGFKYVPKPAPTAPAGHPVGILDVTGCKYAVGEDAKVPGKFMFCNAARPDDSPWCGFHRGECTQPAFGRYATKRMTA